MWIALAIIAFLAAVITVILLLPVHVIIKNDEENALVLRYKFLGKIYGEDPDPNNPIVRTLKKTGGVERLEKQRLKESIQSSGLRQTVAESYAVLADLLREIAALLKYCSATKLHINILCAGEDPAEAAMRYGQACAATYSLLNLLRSVVKIRQRNCKIDIRCDFSAETEIFRYDLRLLVRLNRVLAAFWRVAYSEARRTMAQQRETQAK